MLAPNVRFDGSEHTLVFRGGVTLAVVAPTPYGEAPIGSVPGVPATVRFLLADPADTADTEQKLPGVVFDDNQGGGRAGAAPHTINVRDRTWAQNSRVTVRSLNGTLTNADLTATEWGYDATNGIPYLELSMTFSAFAASAAEQQLEIQIWLAPTDVR